MSNAESETVNLVARLGIAEAQTLKDELSGLLESTKEIRINAEEVGQVDAAILQLLASFWDESARREVTVHWDGASDALRASAKLLGLHEALELV